MNTFINIMDKYFTPVASRIGGQRHMVVVRDSFATAMPLILAGSVAVLLNNFWGALDGIFKVELSAAVRGAIPWFFEINGIVWWGSFAILSIFIVIAIAYRLALSYGEDGISAAVIALAAYFVHLPQMSVINGEGAWGWIAVGNFGPTNLFAAMIVGIVSTEIYVRLVKKNIVIRMPDSVPPAVSRGFVAFVPALVVIYSMAVVSLLLSKASFTVGTTEINNLLTLINGFVQAPFMQLGQSVFTVLIISFFIPLFWFFGLHGANIVAPIINSVYLPAVLENAEAIQNGIAAPNVWTSVSWDAYVHLGGSGATLALILAIILFSRREDYRAVGKVGLAPGIFMINEPVIFGLPIVLNPILFIPFLLNPVVLTAVAYTVTSIGLVPPTSIIIPWTTPPVIGAFLATNGSFAAALLAMFNFTLAFVMYIPFIQYSNRIAIEKSKV